MTGETTVVARVDEAAGPTPLGFRAFLAMVEKALGEGFGEPLLSAMRSWEVKVPVVSASSVEVSYTFDPPLELPPVVAELAGKRLPPRVRRMVVSGAVSVELKGDEPEQPYLPSPVLHLVNPGECAAIFALWLFLKQRGIDFLSDLLKEVEGRVERERRLLECLGRLLAVAEVVTA